jgi:hypothetical protein
MMATGEAAGRGWDGLVVPCQVVRSDGEHDTAGYLAVL